MAIAEPTETPVSQDPPRSNYDAETDTLFFRLNDRQAVAKHLEDELWLFLDPETNAVTGLFVEDFQRVFLKRHPELALAWQNAHPTITRRMSRHLKEGFVRTFLNWLKRENQEVGLALCPG